MSPSYVLLLAFLIGVIGGLRTMTAPAGKDFITKLLNP
jgi:uncharacterized membrane protein